MHIHILTRVAIVPFLFSYFYKIPYVISEHWTRYLPEDNSFKGAIKIYITRFIVKRAKYIMPVSYNLQKGMLRFKLKGNYKILPNVVDTKIFCLKTKAKNENTKLLFVGSLLDEAKNVSQILKVFHTILQQNKNFHLSIIGNGIDRPKHETFVLQNNMNENVSFLGKFSQNDVANEMSKHDFLVLFSNFENLPCVLLEAMSCGLPVIAPNVGGVGEIVNEQNGILVNKNDIEAFKNAILKMQKTHQLYNKERLHNYIQRNYSVQAISEKLKKVYFSAINNV
jgi:glycosyltransferase involved in cell wall biosynthesis